MEKLSFPNPKWMENERMGRWNRGTPRALRFAEAYGYQGVICDSCYCFTDKLLHASIFPDIAAKSLSDRMKRPPGKRSR